MTSTELKIGLTNSNRPSSRVLKPPGGGHSNIFAEPEVSVNPPRPKYNQQNSSNMNACMGSDDPNKMVEKIHKDIAQTKAAAAAEQQTKKDVPETKPPKEPTTNGTIENQNGRGGRVPPGGYSSGGFW